ncbi:MAG: hypothetical protein ACRDRL_03920, partial [Sciscionella sp.]
TGTGTGTGNVVAFTEMETFGTSPEASQVNTAVLPPIAAMDWPPHSRPSCCCGCAPPGPTSLPAASPAPSPLPECARSTTASATASSSHEPSIA